MLDHTGVRPIAHELLLRRIVGALEVHIGQWFGILHPAQHLLVGGEPNILDSGQIVHELVQCFHVASGA